MNSLHQEMEMLKKQQVELQKKIDEEEKKDKYYRYELNQTYENRYDPFYDCF